MNRITEQLSRDRRRCDVGVRVPVAMESKVYQLHRKGSHGQDQYGADLAITISVPELDWVKTALFQMKRSSDASVVIEEHQIHEAMSDNRILKRSFLIAVDEQRSLIRLESISDIQTLFPADQKTHTMDCSQWNGLVYWLHQWLVCDLGEESKSDDPESVESLLESFLLPNLPPEPLDGVEAEQREYYLPARFWMRLLFRSTSLSKA